MRLSSKQFFGAVAVTVFAALSLRGQTITPQEHLRRAGDFLRRNEPTKAIPELSAAVQAQPDNIDAQANLGVLLYFQHDFAAAEPHLRAAVTAQAGLSKIRGLLGLAEKSLGKMDAAREELSKALPDLQDPSFRKQVGLSLVEIDTQQQHLGAAAATIQELQQSAPDDPEILYAAYRVYTDLAGDALLSLSLSAPKSAQMQQAIAHELLRVRDFPGAISSFRRAIAIDPRVPGLHTELAEALHASPDEKDRAGSEAEYRAGLRQNPEDTLAAVHLADILADEGNTAEAARYYQQALMIQPANADALIGTARLDADAGRPQQAEQKLTDVLHADPSNMLAHFRLAALYRTTHRPDEAKRELAEYQKLKQLKDQLRETYSTMKLRSPDAAQTEQR